MVTAAPVGQQAARSSHCSGTSAHRKRQRKDKALTFDEAGQVWGISLPADIAMLSALPADACILSGNHERSIPWPPLSPDEIASAFSVASDWDLQQGMVPVMGDFHDLVCLRYNNGDLIEVVIIDDDRTVHASFPSLFALVQNARPSSSIDSSPQSKALDSSWLDF
jgi:hypothetical protein